MEDEKSLASELLSELKEQNRRLYRALIALSIAFAIVLTATITGFLWYMSLPSDNVSVESQSTGNANYIGMDLKGDLVNGEGNSTETGTQE